MSKETYEVGKKYRCIWYDTENNNEPHIHHLIFTIDRIGLTSFKDEEGREYSDDEFDEIVEE